MRPALLGSLALEHEHLQRDGFTTLDGAFGEVELESLRRAAMRLVEPALASHIDDAYHHYDKGALKHINWPSDLDDEFAELIAHPAIVSSLNALIGPDVQLAFAKLVVKTPRQEAMYDWHQDLVFLRHTNDQLYAVALQLDDFSDGQGAVRLVPGSHHAGLMRHTPEGRIDDPGCLAPAVTLAVPRGSLTIHHSLAVHQSPANRSGRLRLRVLYFYRAADAHVVGHGSFSSGRHANAQVSGQPRHARFQDLPYEQVLPRYSKP